jgi:hypothetical protein
MYKYVFLFQETLETLNLGDPRHDISARDKRTIGFLRQLFPGLSQVSMTRSDQILDAHTTRTAYFVFLQIGT